MKPLVIKGKLHSPYFIFVKNLESVADAVLLKELKIEGYSVQPAASSEDSHLYVIDDGQWMHVADDWGYTLWHTECVRSGMAAVGSSREAFSFWVGDTDNSFGLDYWKDGFLYRQFHYDEPFTVKKGKGKITHCQGSKLAAESKIVLGECAEEHLWEVARSLGIQTNYDELAIRTYYKPRQKSSIWRNLFGTHQTTPPS